MYNEKTVFILGAGASWHYGYPTGAELIELIKRKAAQFVGYWQGMKNAKVAIPTYVNNLLSGSIDSFVQQCVDLKNKLEQVNPLVIDYFLEHHKDLEGIGKLLIAYILLEQELFYKQHKYNRPIKRGENNYSDDWGRFILHELTSGCIKSNDLVKNDVHFVTFNYDVSLENRLYRGLQPNRFFLDEDRESFYKKQNLVLHVYGSLRENPFEDERFASFPDTNDNIMTLDTALHQKRVLRLNLAWEASRHINVILGNKSNRADTVNAAKSVINAAKHVYILGYGFDENNNKLIGIESISRVSKLKKSMPFCRIHFTNYRDPNRINKTVGMTFLKDPTAFLGAMLPSGLAGAWCQKSINNVYDALANDF